MLFKHCCSGRKISKKEKLNEWGYLGRIKKAKFKQQGRKKEIKIKVEEEIIKIEVKEKIIKFEVETVKGFKEKGIKKDELARRAKITRVNQGT